MTETMTTHNWLNPAGPFKTLRNLLSGLLIFGCGASIFTLFAPAHLGGDDGMLLMIMLFIAGPTMLTAIGALWLVDNVLAFVKA